MFPFVASAAGTVASPQDSTRPHTPEAPRRMSRGTPASMARRQAMQRSDGVDAALHAYAASDPSGQYAGRPSQPHEAGGELGVRRPVVEALVTKHAAGSTRYSSSGRASAAGSVGVNESVSGGGAGSMRAPYATLADTGLQAATMHGRLHGGSQEQMTVQEGTGEGEGRRYMRGTDRGTSHRGHVYVQPEWMHVERPAGRAAGIATAGGTAGRGGLGRPGPHMSGGHAAAQTHDQVGEIMHHNEASLRAAPGGEMSGVIDDLARKYGAQSLK